MTLIGKTRAQVDAEQNDREATAKRAMRAALLSEYDAAVAQLSREIRSIKKRGEDTAELEAKLDEWDTWSDALCDLPEQPGWPYLEFPMKPSSH